MPKFIVITDEGKLGDMFRLRKEHRVEAIDAAEARRKVGGRVIKVDQLFIYEVTLRGRDDGRKRETYVTKAINEQILANSRGFS